MDDWIACSECRILLPVKWKAINLENKGEALCCSLKCLITHLKKFKEKKE